MYVGIDFGGSRIRVAMFNNGTPSLIPFEYKSPNVFYTVNFIRENGIITFPRILITPMKRILNFDMSFPVGSSQKNSLDLFSEILGEIKSEVKKLITDGVLNSVLTLPACFSERQRAAYNHSAVAAGFNGVKLLDDTIAALLSSKDLFKEHEKVMVYSWGASTFSAALYHIRGNKFQTISQEGNKNLGGYDLDAKIADKIVRLLEDKLGLSLPCEEPPFLFRLAKEAKKAKISLARGESVFLSPVQLIGESLPSSFRKQNIILAPDIFESLFDPLMSETLELTTKMLAAGKCTNPDSILTVGGMALIPRVEKTLQERFQVPIVHARDDAVAIGGLIYGSKLPESKWNRQRTSQSDNTQAPTYNTIKSAAKNLGIQQEFSKDSAPVGTDMRRTATAAKTPSRWADIFVPFLNSAQKHYEREKLEEAIAEFENLFQELGKFSSNLYQREGDRLVARGNSDQAIGVFKKAILRNPSDIQIAINLVKECYNRGTHVYKNGKPKQAIEILQIGTDAIESNSAYKGTSSQYGQLKSWLARLHHLKSRVLFDLDCLEEAESEVKRSIQLDKQDIYIRDLEIIRDFSKERKKVQSKSSLAKTHKKIGPNKPCPCGSGKKFKKCCGR